MILLDNFRMGFIFNYNDHSGNFIYVFTAGNYIKDILRVLRIQDKEPDSFKTMITLHAYRLLFNFVY